jgi:DNA-binding response OmpR family regulator
MHELLLIDDDREMLEITSAGFREKGYTVNTMTDGKNAVAFIKKNAPDCVILDVMMPGIDGFSICESIRKVSSVPIIFLTGRVTEEDKVTGLLIGADDYIEKPHSFRELEARVRVVLRRTQAATPGKLLFPPLEIDVEKHKAFCEGEDLRLTAQEYDLLYLIVTSEKDVITYEDIGKRVWGVYREPDRRSVMVMVSRLRKKMALNAVTAQMIETVWTEGYRFTGKRAGD